MADGRQAQLWGLVAECAGARGAPISARDACEVAAAVAGVDGAWLSVMSDPVRRALVHATDRRAAELDELHFVLGEGPCVDAFASGVPVLVADLKAVGWWARWPWFTAAAVETGAAAVFVFPLALGVIQVGVLGLYWAGPGVLSPGGLADVLVCADMALVLLLNSRAGTADAVERDGWAQNWWSDDHSEVNQATGMVSVQSGVGLEAALALLRAYAYAHDQALSEVAAAVVARQLRLDR